MKASVISLFHVAVVVIVLSACSSMAQEGRPEFSVTIHGPEIVKFGAYIVVDVLVTNISNRVIPFDDADIPALGEANFDVNVLDAQGKLAPRTMVGKARRGEKPSPGEPEIVFTGKLVERELKPGETLKESVRLGGPHAFGLYDLKPGTYSVSVTRPDFQAGHASYNSVPGESDLAKSVRSQSIKTPSLTAPKPKAIARSNTITITVVP